MEKDKKIFNCNMELTLNIIGGKWKPILIYHIGNKEKLRYGEIKRLIPHLSQRVLSRELKELEQAKLINRKEYNEKILRVEYSLTNIGKDVLPVLNTLNDWGYRYNKKFEYAKVQCK